MGYAFRPLPTSRSRLLRSRVLLLAVAGALASTGVRADIAGHPSEVHALTEVLIVTEPGASPVEGTLVIRDGRVEMVGAGVEIPEEAIVHSRPGRHVYPGLIEPYLALRPEAAPEVEVPAAGGSNGDAPAPTGHENARVHPETRVADELPLDPALLEELWKAGYTTAFVAPAPGIFRGTGAVVSLGDGAAGDQVLTSDYAHAFAFERGRWPDPTPPGSLMGAIALARQVMYDVIWHRDAWRAWRADPESVDRPEENVALRALEPLLDGMPLFLESEDLRMMPRALKLAREFGVRPVIVSGGSDEYRRPERVARWLDEANASLVVAVNYPGVPRWEDEDQIWEIELDDLVHWERAPTNPGVLERAGIPFAITSEGLEQPVFVLERLRRAIRHGLTEEAALAAVTTNPAALLGLDDRIGTLQVGKAANFLVSTGPLFERGIEIEEVWIDGKRHGDDPRRARIVDLEHEWNLEIGSGEDVATVRVKLSRKEGVFVGEIVADSADVLPEPDRASDETEEDETEEDGAEGPEIPEEGELRDVDLTRGVLTFRLPASPDRAGERFTLRLRGKMLEGTARIAEENVRVLGRRAPKKPKTWERMDEMVSEGAPAWPPTVSPEKRPEAVHVRNATIWTCGPEGVLQNADLVAVGGEIRAIGPGLSAPGDARVIDGTGLHVTPGLIDCHSHSSISGGVNEGTESCTAEVRIGDVVNPRSEHIYRELAGGLTISNLLHGSANAIGGQNAVIKLRWGRPADDLLFASAPSGIKFALGENVKQSNWGDAFKTRYPQTRMGVEQFFRERFDAALDYRREWEEWRGRKRGAAPRRDLELDTLLEILDGERLVHCHSYRSDEIIMLIRVAEDYGFRIGTFQHVLEGYKCADEIAAHGAGASSFTDWWSYKFEVVEAIPYSGTIMWDRGVNVSFNSDSSELSRRMNLEGAKAVKYGRMPEDEALKLVTINPAIQLGIDEWVGSLEAGKHADFAIWSAHPLSDAAVCQGTWVDGIRRFSRADDLAARSAAERLRQALLAKARSFQATIGKTDVDEDHVRRHTFGRSFGATEEEEGAVVATGHCVAHGHGGAK